MKEITLTVTFQVGQLEEFPPGGLRQKWVGAAGDGGSEYELGTGAGFGNPLIEAVAVRDGCRVYARSDIRLLAAQLFGSLDSEMTTPASEPGSSGAPAASSHADEPDEPDELVLEAADSMSPEDPEAADTAAVPAAGSLHDADAGNGTYHAAVASDGEPCQVCGEPVVAVAWAETREYDATVHVTAVDDVFARHELTAPPFVTLTGAAGIAMDDLIVSLHERDEASHGGISSRFIRNVRYINPEDRS